MLDINRYNFNQSYHRDNKLIDVMGYNNIGKRSINYYKKCLCTLDVVHLSLMRIE